MMNRGCQGDGVTGNQADINHDASFHAIDLSEVTGCECMGGLQTGAPGSPLTEFKSVFSRALFDWVSDQIANR
jgi:hypothetical protein